VRAAPEIESVSSEKSGIFFTVLDVWLEWARCVYRQAQRITASVIVRLQSTATSRAFRHTGAACKSLFCSDNHPHEVHTLYHYPP
jgi:hypothetical protein